MEDLTPQSPETGPPAIDSEVAGTDKADDTSASAQRQRRMFFITFGSIVFLGLALTVMYLGGRVMETRAAAETASKLPPVAHPIASKPPATVPKSPEVTKPQLVAAAKPAPAPPLPQPVPESKQVPASAPKPQPATDSKTAPAALKPIAIPQSKTAQPPAPPAKAPAVMNASLTQKPQTNPVLLAKSEPIKPAAAAQPASAPKAHGEKGILYRDSKAYSGPFLSPHPGETYVQVGAYSPNYTKSFLAILEKKGFHGVVAQGPSQDVNRVLVGPFPDSSAMQNTHGDLGKAGLTDAFARKY
jgi:cell division septation protein DedD